MFVVRQTIVQYAIFYKVAASVTINAADNMYSGSKLESTPSHPLYLFGMGEGRSEN